MKHTGNKKGIAALGMLVAFLLWTGVICFVDVRPVGPVGSAVGLAGINARMHAMTGVHGWMYILTDCLSLVPFGFMACFAMLGLYQWIHRKSLRKVDRSLLILGGFYEILLGVYLLFETVVINYRPVLIEGVLEASYPSSTTVLVMCVMLTGDLQLRQRVRKSACRKGITALIWVFTAMMVLGRLACGVHWLSDILGGALLSAGLVLGYDAVCRRITE